MHEYSHLATLTLALAASATFCALSSEMLLIQAFSFALTMVYFYLAIEELIFLLYPEQSLA